VEGCFSRIVKSASGSPGGWRTAARDFAGGVAFRHLYLRVSPYPLRRFRFVSGTALSLGGAAFYFVFSNGCEVNFNKKRGASLPAPR